MTQSTYNLDAKVKAYDDSLEWLITNMKKVLQTLATTPDYVFKFEADITQINKDLIAVQVGGNTALQQGLESLLNETTKLHEQVKDIVSNNKDDCDDFKEEIEKQHIQAWEYCQKTIDNFNKSLEALRTTVQNTTQLVNDTKTELTLEMNNTKTEVNNVLNDTKVEINQTIDNTKTEINNTLNETKVEINQTIDNTKTEINNQFNETKTEINNQFNETKVEINQTVQTIDLNTFINDKIYPVGSIFVNTTDRHPNDILGVQFTWKKLEEGTKLAAYNVNTTDPNPEGSNQMSMDHQHRIDLRFGQYSDVTSLAFNHNEGGLPTNYDSNNNPTSWSGRGYNVTYDRTAFYYDSTSYVSNGLAGLPTALAGYSMTGVTGKAAGSTTFEGKICKVNIWIRTQ